MLVLMRRPEEAVLIQGGITVRVLGVVGDRVRLGIEAPEGVGVAREELIGVPVRTNNGRSGPSAA